MKKKIVDCFQSINCISVSIHGCNCCKTGIAVSKCGYLASMSVKIEDTELAIIMIFCSNASLMFMQAKVRGLNAVKIAKIHAFVHRNLFACMEH